MILAEKIILLRKKNNLTQEELADKLGVSRQSVSKWEMGSSIPDINKIIAICDLFGVKTDYLLRDEVENIEYSNNTIEETGNQNIVTAEDAAELMQGYEVFAKGIAVSLLCFIMSPISIFIAQMVYLKTQYMKEDSFGIIGVAITFVVIAFGVYKLVVSLQKNAKFKFIAEEEFTLSYGVKGIVEKAKMLHKKNTSKLTAFAISLYVLGIVPLLIFSIFDSEVLYLFGVVLLLIFVSIASAIVIRNAIINSSYNILLQLEDYSVDNKRFNKKLGAYMGAYWVILTAIYLAISFYTMRWYLTWMIFPVGVLVFVGTVMILKGYFANKKD